MTVLVDYTFAVSSSDVLPNLDDVEHGQMLSNKRLILAGPDGGQVGAVYEGAGSWTSTTMPGTGGSIAYFDSTWVLVSDIGTDISFRFTDVTGVALGADRFLGLSGSDVLNPGIAGNFDGFAIVYQDVVSASDHNLMISFHDSAGTPTRSFAIDASAANDRQVQIAMVNNHYVVAWQRGGGSEIWYAVYDTDGDVVVNPSLLDAEGAINRDVSIAALSDGRFALAYEDSGWSVNDSEIDITVAVFDDNFLPVNSTNASPNGDDSLDPTIVQLGSGHLVVGFTRDDGGDTDVSLAVLDATGHPLEVDTFAGGAGDQGNSFLFTYPAASGSDLRIVHRDDGAGDIVDTDGVVVRTSTGDAADEEIVADGMIDHIYAGEGADTISGDFTRDELNGEGGADVFLLAGGESNFELLDGGTGIDTLRLLGGEIYSHSFQFTEVRSIEVLEYEAAGASRYGAASFNADQIGVDGLSSTATVRGSDDVASSDRFTIRMSSQQSLSLSAMIFEDFDDPLDLIEILGDSDAEMITGGSTRDKITAGGGADVMNGGLGADTMEGGADDDWFFVDHTGDAVVEGAGEGTADRVLTSISYTLGAAAQIELFTTTNAAGTGAINLTGNGFVQTMHGNAGVNVLNGGGGADTMVGFAGDDRYFVDNAGDVVTEGAGQGTADRVLASVNYTLGAAAQVELFTTTNTAGTGAINLTGNGFVQTMHGNAGINTLNGGGGADSMTGFAGDDQYYVDNIGDSIVEGASQGTADRVLTSVNYTLGAAAQIELFTTTNTAGTGAINLTGNGFNQIMHGNAGVNVLNGGGGADNMQGFAGDDWYYVDNTDDVVVDGAAQGTVDRVFASVSIVLTAGAEIEILSTNNGAGTAAINLTGNGFGQSIGGNAGDNVIFGGGGDDSMVGFGGNDRYFVDSLGDSILEQVGGGNDRVSTSVSYTLTSGQEIELFTTTDGAGTGAIDLTGNNLAQSIGGNAGANVLNGGLGNDTLTGFGGLDTFFFNTALGATNIDRIADFSVADDTIRLENAIFAGLAVGALAAGAFNTGAAATEANDRIIYNSATGALLFDADGLDGNAGIQFATLGGGLVLTSADFVVV